MEFSLLDGGGDVKQNGRGFVEMFKIRVRQDAFFFRTILFDRIARNHLAGVSMPTDPSFWHQTRVHHLASTRGRKVFNLIYVKQDFCIFQT